MKFAPVIIALAALGIPRSAAAGPQDAIAAESGSFAEALVKSGFLLSRAVVQVMPDGREIAVTRTYRLRLSPLENGWLIEGESVDVQVDAPPRLAALADLERQRDDSGTFPMRLTRDGMLAPLDIVRPTDGATAAAAGEAVATRIRESAGNDERKDAAIATARTLVGAGQGVRVAWPADLFRPTATQRIESREVGGGTVTIALNARSDPQTGLMRSFERRVTTRLGQSERVVTERWQLRPEPAARTSLD
jgi:hypothetical protein